MIKLVVIGCSLGGLEAMKVILPAIPATLMSPIVIVQHRETSSGLMLAGILQNLTSINVIEPDDKEFIRNGNIYLAPAGYHLLIEDAHFSLSMDAPVNHARPSIDVLFWSAAEYFGNAMLGVLLTGAGNDGARGLLQINLKGGTTIIEDPETAECSSMPKAALNLLKPDYLLPLNRITQKMIELTSPNYQ